MFQKSDRISEKDIGKVYDELFAAFDTDLIKLKKLLDQQKNKEEQDRLRKIQVRIESERSTVKQFLKFLNFIYKGGN